MISIATVLVAGLLASPGSDDPDSPNRARPAVKRTGHELLTAPDRHVRASCARAQELLAQGLRRSSTFASLLQALEATDLIVHVEITPKLPATIVGRLLFATARPGGPRYLRIQIAPDGSRSALIAAIGHELQHALEVGDAPDVRDQESFARLYRRIGLPDTQPGYDTLAAQDTGHRVLLEIGR